MGRGLSELQKRILDEVDREGCIESREAQGVAFELLPKRKQRMKKTSSAKPRCEWGRRRPWWARDKRIFTPSEKRDASVAASASRALKRLCKRGLLEWICMGWVQVSECEVDSEGLALIPPFYMLTDKGRLTVKASRPAASLNR